MHILLRFTMAATLAAAALLAAGAAHAGRSCEARRPDAATIARGLTLAERTLRALEAEHAREGTQVVALARAGQDLSRYGLRHSHLGWAYRTPEGQWRVLHKLNHCGTAEAAVYRQGLGEFFLDDLWRYEAAWIALTPQTQARLLPLLRDDRRATALHHKPYSLVSYAFGTRYQQSNQWALETLASALDTSAGEGSTGTITGTSASREAAQAWLRAQGFRPTTLRLGTLTRLGGRITAANVAFDDHPPEQRWSGRIDTVTVDAVFDWLQRSGFGGAPRSLAL